MKNSERAEIACLRLEMAKIIGMLASVGYENKSPSECVLRLLTENEGLIEQGKVLCTLIMNIINNAKCRKVLIESEDLIKALEEISQHPNRN